MYTLPQVKEFKEQSVDQSFFNWILGTGGVVIGWVLKVIWDSLRDLRSELKSMDSKMHQDFVRRDDFKDAMAEHKSDMQDGFREIKEMIGLLFKKLENKADK
jgi:type VI protein secretion system component VasK